MRMKHCDIEGSSCKTSHHFLHSTQLQLSGIEPQSFICEITTLPLSKKPPLTMPALFELPRDLRNELLSLVVAIHTFPPKPISSDRVELDNIGYQYRHYDRHLPKYYSRFGKKQTLFPLSSSIDNSTPRLWPLSRYCLQTAVMMGIVVMHEVRA